MKWSYEIDGFDEGIIESNNGLLYIQLITRSFGGTFTCYIENKFIELLQYGYIRLTVVEGKKGGTQLSGIL